MNTHVYFNLSFFYLPPRVFGKLPYQPLFLPCPQAWKLMIVADIGVHNDINLINVGDNGSQRMCVIS